MIDIAQKAARVAGEILMEHFKKLPREAIREKQRNDFLSFVDESSEQAIVSILNEHFPEYSILAEEGSGTEQDSEFRWIIDPLDGTTNYINGLPVFCVSIALQKNGAMILGVIYDPVHEEMFSAEKGKGAFLNDQALQVSKTKLLSQSFIATGFPFKAKHLLKDYLSAFETIFRDCIGMRRMGSAAIDLAYVAAGRFDGFWELGLSPWDMAAGAIIIEEAGGRISDFWERPDYLKNSYVIASNGLIHKQLMNKVQLPFPKPVNVFQDKGV